MDPAKEICKHDTWKLGVHSADTQRSLSIGYLTEKLVQENLGPAIYKVQNMPNSPAQRYCLIDLLRCSLEIIKEKFPISTWLPSYSLQKLRGDVIAGTAVGLMVVPQSLAVASLAGLDPQYGLYSSFPGVFVYLFLGTSKDLNVGPTVMNALMTRRYNVMQNAQMASILAFLTGIVLFGIGLFKIGFIVQFISSPVFSGFVSAAAIAITASQIDDLLGLPKGPRPFFQRLKHIFINIQNTRPGDAVLGLGCLAFLLSFHVASKRISKPGAKKWPKFLRKVVLGVNVGKSALVAIIATIVVYLFHVSGHSDVFVLAGKLPKGMPPVQSPLKTVQISSNSTMELTDAIASFGSGIGLLPLIAFIETIAVSKALARRNKYKIDASQELIAVGISNVACAFFTGFPITGSFVRSAVNSASGATTPATGVVTGVIVILAIQFITPVFKFIPMTALAAMVIASVLTMIEFNLPRKLWKTVRLDLLPFAVSFFFCFYELEMGIIVGAAVSLALILYRDLRPRIAVTQNSPVSKTLKINGGMTYAGAEFLSDKLKILGESFERKDELDVDDFELIIDCQNMFEIDYTVTQNLKAQIFDLNADGIRVKFINIASDRIRNVLEASGLLPLQTEQQEPKNSSAEEHLLCYESAL